MLRTTRWTLLALPLVLAACGGGEEEEANMELADTLGVADTGAGMATDTGAMAGGSAGMAVTVTLNPVGGSQANGQATMTPGTSDTQVQITLNGLEPNSAHAGHIHQGTCASLGSVVVPLPEITADANGTGTATGSATVQTSTLHSGQHVISYHQSGSANPGAPIACGEIQHQM